MRNDGTTLQLFGAVTDSGWRVIRHRVSLEDGQRNVAAGAWAEVHNDMNQLVGYQVLAMRETRGDVDLSSLPLPVSITAGQMGTVAFTGFRDGESRTIGLTEGQRLERAARTNIFTGKRLEPEDRIERTIRKVQVFARITGAKGDILRVWPRGAAEPLAV